MKKIVSLAVLMCLSVTVFAELEFVPPLLVKDENLDVEIEGDNNKRLHFATKRTLAAVAIACAFFLVKKYRDNSAKNLEMNEWLD
jgi:hypothetical protein